MSRMLDKKDKRGRYPFQWVPAAETDIAKRFREIRREQEKTPKNVTVLRERKL